jgi:hypothetical protein
MLFMMTAHYKTQLYPETAWAYMEGSLCIAQIPWNSIPSWETNSHLDSQEIPNLLRNPSLNTAFTVAHY